jgi:NitT/TauT family transport system substrate-binding protein
MVMKRNAYVAVLLSLILSINAGALKLGYSGSLYETPVFIAEEKSLFRKEGLDIDFVKIAKDRLEGQLASGQVDLALISPYEIKNPEKIKFVGAVSAERIEVIGLKKSGINSIIELKGLRIGIDRNDPIGKTAISIELRRAEFDPSKDVKWVLSDGGDLKKLLTERKIDCYVKADVNEVIDQTRYKRIFDIVYEGTYKFAVSYFLGSGTDFYDKNSAEIFKILKVLKNASDWVSANKTGSLEVLSRTNYIDRKYSDPSIFDNFGWHPVTEKEINRFTNFKKELKSGDQYPIAKSFIKINSNLVYENSAIDYNDSEYCCEIKK